MIIIREDASYKLPGITSLFITFKFNQTIINLIKNCNAYKFDKKSKTWELPVNCLAYILDNLTYFDDIELTLMKTSEKEEVVKPLYESEYKLRPFDYQMEGIEYGINNKNWLLLDAYVPLTWLGTDNSTFTDFKYFYCEYKNPSSGWKRW